MTTRIKQPSEIIAMREGGKILSEVLQKIVSNIKSGMSTMDLNAIAERELQKYRVRPAFKGYQGFPEVLCVSVNDEVVHGIPNANNFIKNGDIVSCDFGVLHKGLITDAAVTVIVGNPKESKDIELVRVTKKALEAGIKVVRDGCYIGDIGDAVQRVLYGSGFGIVQEFVGHGVGHELHEEPGIPNYGHKGTGFRLRAGMTVAIEPMATIGDPSIVISDDGWTVRTRDGLRAAHFEHTILVTDKGSEILTA